MHKVEDTESNHVLCKFYLNIFLNFYEKRRIIFIKYYITHAIIRICKIVEQKLFIYQTTHFK